MSTSPLSATITVPLPLGSAVSPTAFGTMAQSLDPSPVWRTLSEAPFFPSGYDSFAIPSPTGPSSNTLSSRSSQFARLDSSESIVFHPRHQRQHAGFWNISSTGRMVRLNSDQSATPLSNSSQDLSGWEQQPRSHCVLRPVRVVEAIPGFFSPGGTQPLYAVRPNFSVADIAPAPVPKSETCAICLEPFRQGELVQPMVSCPHLFHHGCVSSFVQAAQEQPQRNILCPLCRGPMVSRNLQEVPEDERDAVVVLDQRRRVRSGDSYAASTL